MKIKYSCKKKKEFGPGDYVLVKSVKRGLFIEKIVKENTSEAWFFSDDSSYFKWRVQRHATSEEILEFKSKNNIS